MSKKTPNKKRQWEKPPTSWENPLVSSQPESGESQQGRFTSEGPASRSSLAEDSRPSHEQIAVLAYHLWVAHGRRVGTDRDDWFQAERLLREES